MQGEGSLLLHRSSTGTLLLDLRSEAKHTFGPFGDVQTHETARIINIDYYLVNHNI